MASVYDDMSLAEKDVANFLFDHDIWWNYEQPIYVTDDKSRPRVWSPDFFLPELGVYIEVCGAERKETYLFRKKVFEINRIPVIFVHTYKGDRWKQFLLKEIKKIHENRWEIVRDL